MGTIRTSPNEPDTPEGKELALASEEEDLVVFVARGLTSSRIRGFEARFNADRRVTAWDFRDHDESMSYRLQLDPALSDDEAEALVDELADEVDVLKVVLTSRWEGRGGRRGG